MQLFKRPIFKTMAALLLLIAFLIVPLASALDLNEQQIKQTAQRKYGAKGVQNVEAWLNTMATLQGAPEQQLLREINNFWNKVALAGEDINIWGAEDYWATPLETLGRAAADCEDYVIGKYFSLIHLGVPADKLRFIYVRARVGGASIAHMVLGYYASPNAEPLLLDNLTGIIRPASQRPDLTPVFSFNSEGVYVSGSAPSSVDRISRWRGLLDKMRSEGFTP
ncbi:transglutaminase-like cysteine peptidase [Paenalcaligenes faecalis]|uniref:transglutaminase-like cysteine peptidase n=1 Tax=Paenalcaligenes faecalis TaxID=2980099 RepID=UPI0022B9A12A|nr:transglutaminase-like cysteine peptidase [Paenalcaligenes faecalis]